jgi:hypothetical protein
MPKTTEFHVPAFLVSGTNSSSCFQFGGLIFLWPPLRYVLDSVLPYDWYLQ